MNEKEYFEHRVKDQIDWYDKKSVVNKKRHITFQIIIICLALSIPLLNILESQVPIVKYFISFFAVIVGISSAISALKNYKENWINYRTTAESLKHEKFLFLTKSGPYQMEQDFTLFVERFENLISKENSNWSNFTQKDSSNKKA